MQNLSVITNISLKLPILVISFWLHKQPVLFLHTKTKSMGSQVTGGFGDRERTLPKTVCQRPCFFFRRVQRFLGHT